MMISPPLTLTGITILRHRQIFNVNIFFSFMINFYYRICTGTGTTKRHVILVILKIYNSGMNDGMLGF